MTLKYQITFVVQIDLQKRTNVELSQSKLLIIRMWYCFFYKLSSIDYASGLYKKLELTVQGIF